MSERLNIPPLPSEEDYITAMEYVVDNKHINSAVELERAIKREAAQDKEFSVGMRNAEHWGRLVEPFDRSTRAAVHSNKPVGQAIRLGSGFGLLMLPQAHREFVTFGDAIANIPTIDQPDPSDPHHYRHEIAAQVVGLGQEGIQFLGPEVDDRLMDLEMKIVQEVEHQRMFRIGCGIVALGGFIAHEKRIRDLSEQAVFEDRQKFEKSLESVHDVDWDTAFKSLLGDSGS